MADTRKDLSQLYERLGLSNAARCLIENIRSSEPARAVESGRNNVRGIYPSEKMGKTIQFESANNELPRIKEYERDDQVIEYYDQPSVVKLEYDAANGRRVGVLHTPDFLVIRTDSAGWEECKKEEELVLLAEQSPNRYCKDEEGQWRCPPGEAYAEVYGLFYRVRSSADINWTYQRNLTFLEDYFRVNSVAVSEEKIAMVRDLVSVGSEITLSDLYLRTGDVVSRDEIHFLIAREIVFVNLFRSVLADPDRVRVFSNKEVAEAFAEAVATNTSTPADHLRYVDLAATNSILWDGRAWTILNAGETMVGILGVENEFREIPLAAFEKLAREGRITGLAKSDQDSVHPEARRRILAADKPTLAEANRRATLVRMSLNGEDTPDYGSVPDRTLRSWLAEYRRAEQMFGVGYVGLLPKARPGNRRRKLPEASIVLLEEFIEHDYETLKGKNKSEVYGAYLRACKARGVIAASYKTFCRFVKSRSRYNQVLKRKGKRAALADKPFYWVLESTTPRHGERPFEIVHVDHTQFDVELICSQTGQNLGRPWGSIMVDAYSRRLLAVYATFDPPANRSCMMVLRECVKRFGRLPQTIVVDGGKEFQSTYFDTLLARFECAKKIRPPAQSRYGSVCERLFGTLNTRFIHNLEGNTQLMKNVRQVTGSINPKRRAIWTLEAFHSRLQQFAYEIYDQIEHPALGVAPREAFATGMAQAGNRPHRLIEYGDDFIIFTLPSSKKGVAQVLPGRGIKLNSLYYWSETFRHPEVEGTQVPVRIDPFDVGTAYAFVLGQWVRCHSEYYAIFQGRSEREIRIASEELRRRRTLHSRQFNLTASKIAEFIESVEAEEILLTQRLRDYENRIVVESQSKPYSEQRNRGESEDRNAPEPGKGRSRSKLKRRVKRAPQSRNLADDNTSIKSYGSF